MRRLARIDVADLLIAEPFHGVALADDEHERLSADGGEHQICARVGGGLFLFFRRPRHEDDVRLARNDGFIGVRRVRAAHRALRQPRRVVFFLVHRLREGGIQRVQRRGAVQNGQLSRKVQRRLFLQGRRQRVFFKRGIERQVGACALARAVAVIDPPVAAHRQGEERRREQRDRRQADGQRRRAPAVRNPQKGADAAREQQPEGEGDHADEVVDLRQLLRVFVPPQGGEGERAGGKAPRGPGGIQQYLFCGHGCLLTSGG